jgi:hypothetical protein
MKISNERAKILWKNSRDSKRHALEHFSELSCCNISQDDHHRKWIILSVHHSAEIFAYMLLKEFDEFNEAFFRGENHYYPGIEKAINVLFDLKFCQNMTGSEKKLLKLFRKLDGPRNKIIHGEIPEQLDVSIMAMALIGMTRISKHRCGESADDIIDQSPTIRREVVEAVHSSNLEEYSKFIEAFVQEDNRDRYIDTCPYCGTLAVLDGQCEACFEELEKKECPHCGEQNLHVCGLPIPEVCGSCGKELST